MNNIFAVFYINLTLLNDYKDVFFLAWHFFGQFDIFFWKIYKNEPMIPNDFLLISIHFDFVKAQHIKRWNQSDEYFLSNWPSKWGHKNEQQYSMAHEPADSAVHIVTLPLCYLSETLRHCLYVPKQLFCEEKMPHWGKKWAGDSFKVFQHFQLNCQWKIDGFRNIIFFFMECSDGLLNFMVN